MVDFEKIGSPELDNTAMYKHYAICHNNEADIGILKLLGINWYLFKDHISDQLGSAYHWQKPNQHLERAKTTIDTLSRWAMPRYPPNKMTVDEETRQMTEFELREERFLTINLLHRYE